jgi:hypothetical protein
MKPERMLLDAVWLLLLAGLVAWLSRSPQLQKIALWIGLGAFGVACLPLLGWLIHTLVKRTRD